MKPIRVLQLFFGFTIEGPLGGGAERFGIELSRALDKTQVQSLACSLWNFNTPFEKEWRNMLQLEGIPTFTGAAWEESSPYRAFYKAVKGLKNQLAGQSIDIIHSHTQFTDVAAILVKHTLNAKVLIRTVHNEREWPKQQLWRRLILTDWVYPLIFDIETGVSKQVVTNLNNRSGARLLKKEARCIYNAINLQRFENLQIDCLSKKRDLNLPEDAIIIGSIGRLAQQKGYTFLIQAAQKVIDYLPQARFIIIGGGDLHNELITQIHSLGLDGKVILTGPQKNIESLIAIMDVFALSSLWEGLPTTILESFAMGVPVVATDVSGSRELIKSEYNGLLVPPANATSLAKAIIKISTEKEFAFQLAQNAKNTLNHFTISQVASQYTEIYLNTMGTNF